MKNLIICAGLAMFSLLPATQAAVIQLTGRIEVAGVLDGGIIAPGVTGDTMDYLTFEVLTTTTVTVTSGFNSAFRLRLAAFIGITEDDGTTPFGFLGNPYILDQTNLMTRDSLTRTLNPGIYVTSMAMRERNSYDVFDGYMPVNREGGGFTSGPYGYSISGDVRALEFREGNLNNTFTITVIPEPSAAGLLCGSAFLLWHRNASNRKENKALLPTPRGWLVSMLYFIRKCLGFGRAHSRP
jgi:hypothetical protein